MSSLFHVSLFGFFCVCSTQNAYVNNKPAMNSIWPGRATCGRRFCYSVEIKHFVIRQTYSKVNFMQFKELQFNVISKHVEKWIQYAILCTGSKFLEKIKKKPNEGSEKERNRHTFNSTRIRVSCSGIGFVLRSTRTDWLSMRIVIACTQAHRPLSSSVWWLYSIYCRLHRCCYCFCCCCCYCQCRCVAVAYFVRV